MDNRLENLVVIPNNIFYLPFKPDPTLNFYWNIVSLLPIDMDEVDYHGRISNQSSLYECHNSPCTELITNEQFICLKCNKIK
jgi:hypothetical protein